MPESGPKIGKPIKERITYEIDGEPRRLAWVAENKPEFLINELVHGPSDRNTNAIKQALFKAGWNPQKIYDYTQDHPEMRIGYYDLDNPLGLRANNTVKRRKDEHNHPRDNY